MAFTLSIINFWCRKGVNYARMCKHTLRWQNNSNKDKSLVAWYDFVMQIGVSIYEHFSFTFLLNGSLIALFWAVWTIQATMSPLHPSLNPFQLRSKTKSQQTNYF